MSLYLGENLISGNKPINLGVRNIGEIFPALLPVTDAGAHLLDGSLILGGGIYQGFVDYIANIVSIYPDVFTTESAWQSSVTTYGVCGKFVYNATDNTVRLPKVTGIIEGTTDVTALGDLVEAGLPVHTHTRGTMNITGYVGGGLGVYGGAFYHGWDYSGSAADGGGSTDAAGSFDASRSWTGNTSNPIYTDNIQNSSTVQPQTIKVLYYIVIANSTKTEIQTDIDEVVTDLNGKADTDLTNCTNVANIKMAHNAMPSNTFDDLTLGASGTQYTAPADGWFYLEKVAGSDFYYIEIVVRRTDNNAVLYRDFDSDYRTSPLCLMVRVKKGSKVDVNYNATGTTNYFRFIYAVGSESEAS